MCIRDSYRSQKESLIKEFDTLSDRPELLQPEQLKREHYTCLLYTSDAADERSSVDLGGRRIIKKKKHRDLVPRHVTKNKHNYKYKTIKVTRIITRKRK